MLQFPLHLLVKVKVQLKDSKEQAAATMVVFINSGSIYFTCSHHGVGVRGRVEIERARSYQDFDILSHLMLIHGYVHLLLEYAVV